MWGPGQVAGPQRDQGRGLIWPRINNRGQGRGVKLGVGDGGVPAQPGPALPRCHPYSPRQ